MYRFLFLLLVSCYPNDVTHSAVVPTGLPFLARATFTVNNVTLDPNRPYTGCVQTPDTWTVDPHPLYSPDLDPSAPPPSFTAVAGWTWHCFEGNTTAAYLLIVPNTVGGVRLNWTVNNDSYALGDAWYQRSTSITVRPSLPDEDSDGVDAIAHGGTDCDDLDANRNPTLSETCDGVDEDCDGATDEAMPDFDADGVCDGLDFHIEFDAAVPGQTSSVNVRGAPPDALITFVLAASTGAPRCSPTLVTEDGAPLCILVGSPFFRHSDYSATFNYLVPRGAPVGSVVYAQASWTLNGVGEMSPVLPIEVVAP